MAENYSDILRVRIGRVRASVKAGNYFPVAGKDTVRIDAETEWGQTSEWQTQDGSGGTVTTAGNLVKQKDSKSIAISYGGELLQKFIARNNLTETAVSKRIYAMLPQVLPYFTVSASEVVRVGELFVVTVSPEHGYSGASTMVVKVYRENEDSYPVKTLTEITGRPMSDGTVAFTSSFDNASDRGIYDVEVDVTDTATGVTSSKRIDKLITVVPALCPRPADTTQGYETITVQAEKQYEMRLWRDVDGSGLNYAEWTAPHGSSDTAGYDLIDLSALPAGTTLCIRRENGAVYPMRMRIKGNVSPGVSSENGTPNFTYEKPLVITHDENEIFDWPWMSFGAVTFGDNMRNVVLDGYGYNRTGIRFHPSSDDAAINTCIFVSGGAGDIEMFGIDIDGTGFAGIMAKTDPDPDVPWFWRGNWVLDNLRIHHCTIQNTAGEGVYLGYYGSGKLKGTNGQGQEVEYYAHLLDHLRLYRVNFINTGLDSFQVNNAINVDICYVNTTGSGASKQGGQNYASSSVFDGRLYNCRLLKCNGPIAFCGPLLGEVRIYNNVMEAARYSGAFVSTLWKSSQYEHIDLDGNGVVDEIGMYIYNNVIKGYSLGSFNTDYTLAKYFMDDNIIITEIGTDKVPTMFTGGEGNVFLKASTDYGYIDELLKVGDSANSNYQPNYNSSLIKSGMAGRTKYDIRGYQNWYKTINRSGPFLGIYKDTTVENLTIQLAGIVINSGTMDTTERAVSVKFNYMGQPTRYRIAEVAGLSGVEWVNWAGDTIAFTLSEGYGEKTIYAQIATDDTESGIVSAGISYGGIIQFADPEVKRICVSIWDKDGDGELSLSEAQAATTINRYSFSGNTEIQSFDELKLFTGLQNIDAYAFSKCTALRSISFPDHLTGLKSQVCQGNTSLETVHLPDSLTSLGGGCFSDCNALRNVTIPEGVISLNDFAATGLEEIVIPDSVTSIGGFRYCASLRKVDIGTGVTTFLQNAFNNCTALEVFIIRAGKVPSYAGWTLPDGWSGSFYVPDDLVEAYRAANGWKNFSTSYKPLSEYVE